MDRQLTNELIDKSLQGDTKAFSRLVEEHQALVYRLAFRLLYDPENTQDIVQDTFVKAWTNLNRFDNRLKFTTWLCKIATNLCYDQLRRLKHIHNEPLSPANENTEYSGESTETAINNEELMKIIHNLTDQLTPKQKLIFTLRDLEEMEIEEIKEITGLSNAKIKSNLYLARKYIREQIKGL